MSLLIREVVAKYKRSRQSVRYAIGRGSLSATKNKSGDWEVNEKSAEKYYTKKRCVNSKDAAMKRLDRVYT